MTDRQTAGPADDGRRTRLPRELRSPRAIRAPRSPSTSSCSPSGRWVLGRSSGVGTDHPATGALGPARQLRAASTSRSTRRPARPRGRRSGSRTSLRSSSTRSARRTAIHGRGSSRSPTTRSSRRSTLERAVSRPPRRRPPPRAARGAVAGRDRRSGRCARRRVALPCPLAFDHAEILGMAVKRIRGKLDYAPIGFELLPASFSPARPAPRPRGDPRPRAEQGQLPAPDPRPRARRADGPASRRRRSSASRAVPVCRPVGHLTSERRRHHGAYHHVSGHQPPPIGGVESRHPLSQRPAVRSRAAGWPSGSGRSTQPSSRSRSTTRSCHSCSAAEAPTFRRSSRRASSPIG